MSLEGEGDPIYDLLCSSENITANSTDCYDELIYTYNITEYSLSQSKLLNIAALLYTLVILILIINFS